MIEVRVETIIDASPDAVWRVLTDLAAYPAWNPFIRSARGSLEVGGTVRLRIRTGYGIPLAFHATIVTLQPARELRWRGTVLDAWLASGEHAFVLEPVGDGRTRLTHSEAFAGLLPRVARPLIEHVARRGFDAMNHALAMRVERVAPEAWPLAGPPPVERGVHARSP